MTEPEPLRARAGLWRRLGVDTGAWRSSREFRLLWTSGSITMIGSFVTFVTVPLQIKQITGSYLAVGAVGAVELVPMVLFGLYGGALADALDRRTVVLASEAALGVLSGALLVNSLLPSPLLWPLYLFAGLAAALDGLQRPSLDALVPRIVPHDQLTGAAALTALRWNVGAIVCPALGGLIAATAGVGVAYTIDVVTFLLAVAVLCRMKPVPASPEADRPSVRGIVEGIGYAVRRPELMGTYLVDLVAMFFAMPNAVFPFLADQLGAPWSLGIMYAASSVGSLLVTATSGWTARVYRHGRMVVLSAAVWGLAVAGAGLTSRLWLVLSLLAAAGAADMVSGLFRSTIWNQTIPDELRGRLAGIELLSYSVGPQLGQVRVSGMAALMGVRSSIWIGGVACVGGVVTLTAMLPSFLSYDSRTNEHAVRMRERNAAAAHRD